MIIGALCDHLLYFGMYMYVVVMCSISPIFGILYQEKSGNPDSNCNCPFGYSLYLR
jgi:hypothetical protein